MRCFFSPIWLLVLLLTVAGMAGCDKESRARRAARSKPLDRFEVKVSDHVPARLFTSRTGPQETGRPLSVFVEVKMRTGVLNIATQVLGVGGIKVVGGGRLNHGSSARTRTLERSITAELPPDSRGSLLVELAWRVNLQEPEQHLQVAIPMPAKAGDTSPPARP